MKLQLPLLLIASFVWLAFTASWPAALVTLVLFSANALAIAAGVLNILRRR